MPTIAVAGSQRPQDVTLDRDPNSLLGRDGDPRASWGLFLDVDGTLLEFSDTPQAVAAPATLVSLLGELAAALSGAVALVSGRPVAQLDLMFAPLRLPSAGVHGLERRGVDGWLHRERPLNFALRSTTQALEEFAALHPGLLVEDKGSAVALHFRQAPGSERTARIMIHRLAASLGPHYQVLEGHRVFEIKPVSIHKGTAIEAFLAEPPFAGRVPVFLGDDVTDRSGFEVVRHHGGVAIAVGPRVSTSWKLPDPAAVRRWLAGILAALAPVS